jgi:hypothetical protein
MSQAQGFLGGAGKLSLKGRAKVVDGRADS